MKTKNKSHSKLAMTWGLGYFGRVFCAGLQIILQILLPVLSLLTPQAHASDTRETVQPFTASQPQDEMPSGMTNGLSRMLTGVATDGAQDTAISAAGSYAASSAEQWLSLAGTARIQLNVDADGNWDDSAFDFLMPLYDNQKSVLFSQVGVRAPDGRTTGNAGFGVRTFYTERWMFGGNVFFDDDFTGKNRRVGIGGEAWTDYLKLSANTYAGTTEWHRSRDFDDYNEKPADGFDVRAEGYLPAYSQLGARVMYEQYYGDDVALFDKDHLQSNPSAITVGLNYTPVPLITAGVDYKRGQDSMDETHFSLNIRYALGESWQSQISSDQVAIRRSLAGSRYDLVDRNNEIVLQYKKKEDSSTLADMTLTPVRDNSPADGTTMNTATLHAFTSTGKPAANAAIIWSVTGGAKLSTSAGVTDADGNASISFSNITAEKVMVSATSGGITRTAPSTFGQYVASLGLQLTKNGSQANGVDQNAGRATLKDASGKILPGVAVTWSVDHDATIVDSDAVTDSHGQASTYFTSTIAGPVKLTASAAGKNEVVNSTFGSQQVATVAVEMTKNGSEANGTATDTARAVVTDASGKLLAGVDVSWTLNGSAVATTAMTSTTDAGGVATLSLTDTVAENVNVSASAGGQKGNTAASFTEVPVSAVAVNMTTNGVAADGVAANIAQAVVTDASGKPLAGVDVTWTLSGSAVATTAMTVATDGNGVATLSLTDTRVENVDVSANAGGQKGSATANFTAIPVSAVAVNVIKDGSAANGTTANTARAVVTDASGKPLAGVDVVWTLSGSAVATTPKKTTTDTNGEAMLSLTDTVAESVTLTASAGGQSSSPVPSTFVALKAVSITLTKTGKGNKSDPGQLVAVIKDELGHPVVGAKVTWFSAANRFLQCNSGETVTDPQGQVKETCYANGGNVMDQIFTVTVGASYTADPTTPVTDTEDYDFLL